MDVERIVELLALAALVAFMVAVVANVILWEMGLGAKNHWTVWAALGFFIGWAVLSQIGDRL